MRREELELKLHEYGWRFRYSCFKIIYLSYLLSLFLTLESTVSRGIECKRFLNAIKQLWVWLWLWVWLHTPGFYKTLFFGEYQVKFIYLYCTQEKVWDLIFLNYSHGRTIAFASYTFSTDNDIRSRQCTVRRDNYLRHAINLRVDLINWLNLSTLAFIRNYWK